MTDSIALLLYCSTVRKAHPEHSSAMEQWNHETMHHLYKKWNYWWLREAPPHGIALFRILFGAYMLLYWGLRLPHGTVLFSDVGLVIPYDLSLPEALRFLLIPPPAWIALALLCMFLMSLVTFMVGCATRTSACIAFLFYAYYMYLSLHHYATSYNRLFLFLLFLFTFSDAGKTFSHEMWRKHGSPLAWEPGSVLTQRLITVQITATYLGVGWQKLWLPAWRSGEILLSSFQEAWATPLARWFAGQPIPPWVYDGAVRLVTWFEVFLPFGLWIRKARPWFIVGGILFHVGISLFLSAIWWFAALPMAYFLFYEPEEIYEVLKRWWGDSLQAKDHKPLALRVERETLERT